MSGTSSASQEDHGEDSNESHNVEACTPPKLETDTSKAAHHGVEDEKASDPSLINVSEAEVDSEIFESYPTEESLHADDGYAGDVDIDCDKTLKKEELVRKLQEVGFIIRTDVMTLQKRLIIMKRLRDQAETNVERNVNVMKTKLNNLKYLCFDSDSLQQLTDLRKDLDVIFKCATHMSRTSEAYGFVQQEDSMTKAVSIIVRLIDSIERAEIEASSSPDSKSDGRRAELLPLMDEDRQEERLLRRRSVAALNLNGTARRRASIASMPRNTTLSSDSSGSYYSPTQFGVNYSKSPPGTSKRNSISPLARDAPHARLRKESRTGDERYAPKYIQKYGSNSITDENEDLLDSSDEFTPVDDLSGETASAATSCVSLTNRQRNDLVASECQNVIHSLRNVFLLRNCRFQLPNTPQQYASFLFTWYIVILVAIIFMAGFFLGYSRCVSYQLFYFYTVMYSYLMTIGTSLTLLMRIRFVKWALLTAVVFYIYDVVRAFAVEGPEEAFTKLGLEKRYNHNPPPV